MSYVLTNTAYEQTVIITVFKQVSPHVAPIFVLSFLHLLTLTWTLQHFWPCKFEWHDGEYNNNVFLFWLIIPLRPKKITHISSVTVPMKYFRIVDSVVTSVWWALEVQWMRFWLWPWRDPVTGTYCLSGHSLVKIIHIHSAKLSVFS